MSKDAPRPRAFHYQELNAVQLERAMDDSGEVCLVLDRKRADLFTELIELQGHHDRLQAEQHSVRVRLRAAIDAAWFLAGLSFFHRRLLEAQRLAFVLSSSYERQDSTEAEVVFRFIR